ncbi:MAG TPA: hypothetical protein VFG89_06060 [Coriobacteriia bacterium]|nr:hypothetical protein [Coriobacteriia bacterium]
MILVLAKILVAPLLLAASTFAAHRWGGAVGGWLLGLPLMSGPVSVLLFVEHGPGFTRSAAEGALMGIVATGIFCLAYTVMAPRSSWWRSLVIAYAACLGTVWLLSHVALTFNAALGFALGALLLLALLVEEPAEEHTLPTPRKRMLAMRMVISSVSVFAITASAWFLGAKVAGLLAPLPVLAAVMAASAHRNGGRAARGILRGTVLGAWGGAGFFAVVGLLIGDLSPVAVYAAAVGAAVAAGGVAMKLRTFIA